MASLLDRALAYMEKMDPAVSGSGGHNQTLRAACECFRLGLSSAEAWQALEWFNQYRCVPPWKERELRHKLADAERIVRQSGQAGVKAGRPKFRAAAAKTWVAPPPPVRPVVRAVVPVAQRSAAEEEEFWTRVAASRGLTLEQFDVACGLVPEPAGSEEVLQHG